MIDCMPARFHSLLDVIHGLGDRPERVMLFGHNPELTEFAHRLSGEITHMPTCAVPSLRSVRSRGETSAKPTSQEWRSTIQRKRNRRATHALAAKPEPQAIRGLWFRRSSFGDWKSWSRTLSVNYLNVSCECGGQSEKHFTRHQTPKLVVIRRQLKHVIGYRCIVDDFKSRQIP
jgi:hypothetical protein